MKNLQPLKVLKKKKGFTLVELLIVISIVAILSAVVMSNFTLARQKGRDARRKADIQSIQSALELYRSDIGSYPVTAALASCGNSASLPGTGTYSGVIYMRKIPCGPDGTTPYTYVQSGTTYTITTTLENTKDPDLPTGSTTYTVYGP